MLSTSRLFSSPLFEILLIAVVSCKLLFISLFLSVSVSAAKASPLEPDGEQYKAVDLPVRAFFARDALNNLLLLLPTPETLLVGITAPKLSELPMTPSLRTLQMLSPPETARSNVDFPV